MQPTEETVGIKIYTATPPQNSSPSHVPKPNALSSSAAPSRKARVAKGVQTTISKTSMLVNFLPTGTLLTFEMVLPSIYRTGDCNSVNTLMIHLLLALCSLSCFFFHFTDSYKSPDGKMFYGFVTPKGLAVFNPGIDGVEIPKDDDRYKLRFNDFVHAVMSVMVFVAIAFSDHRVTSCLFPGKEKEMDQVMESFPLMVGIVCSGLFLVFPKSRFGIGCMSA